MSKHQAGQDVPPLGGQAGGLTPHPTLRGHPPALAGGTVRTKRGG